MPALSDPAAERAVLAGVCEYGTDIFLDICDIVKTNTFNIRSNQCIWKCLEHIIKNSDTNITSVDLPSILSAAQELGLTHIVERTEEAKHLNSILKLHVNKDNVRKFAGKVRKLEIARLIYQKGDILKEKMLEVQGIEPIAQILAIAEDVVFDFTSLMDDPDSNPTKLGSDVEEYIKYLEQNPVQQMGISTGFPNYDRVIGGGLRDATLNVIGARPKQGKMQPYSSVVWTPEGPKTMGELIVGDIVCTPDGKTAPITHIVENGQQQVYRVHFDDGTSTLCGPEHLWLVKHSINHKPKVAPLKEILSENLYNSNNDPKWYVPVTKPVEFNKRELRLDPYKMGEFIAKNPEKVSIIPEDYLLSDVQDRIALLQGIMDTKGKLHIDTRPKYITSNKAIVDNIIQLVQSLGFLGRYQQINHNGKITYQITIYGDNISSIFRNKYKKSRCRIKWHSLNNRKIVKVEKEGIENCRCIYVDHKDHLYLTDHFIVTHNTILSDNMGYHIAKNSDIPVLNLDTEMLKEDHQHRTLALLSGVSINDIETGQFGQDPIKREKVYKAAKELNSVPYYHKSIAGMPFEDQLSLMRRWVQKEVGLNPDGTSKECVIIYDYLKLMESTGISDALREFQILGFMMTALHNFAVRYKKVRFLIFMQLNRDGIDRENTDVASGSDRIIWLCSNFSIFKRKSEEEVAEDGPLAGNRKLVILAARHGQEVQFGDYINCHMEGWRAKITEGKWKSQLGDDDRNGFEVEDDDDIPFE